MFPGSTTAPKKLQLKRYIFLFYRISVYLLCCVYCNMIDLVNITLTDHNSYGLHNVISSPWPPPAPPTPPPAPPGPPTG